MNNIVRQEVGGEQGCARVHEHQEQSQRYYCHLYSDFSVKSYGKEKDICVSEITSQESGIRRGVSAKDEVEKEEAGEVEKERGVMPEDEEVKADGGEVEKILMRTYLLNTVLQE